MNAADQRRDPNSMLNWTERIIRMRKEVPEIGWGDFEVLTTRDPAVLAIRYDWRNNSVVFVHNLEERMHPSGNRPERGVSHHRMRPRHEVSHARRAFTLEDLGNPVHTSTPRASAAAPLIAGSSSGAAVRAPSCASSQALRVRPPP